jgi:hypothetical protein
MSKRHPRISRIHTDSDAVHSAAGTKIRAFAPAGKAGRWATQRRLTDESTFAVKTDSSVSHRYVAAALRAAANARVRVNPWNLWTRFKDSRRPRSASDA